MGFRKTPHVFPGYWLRVPIIKRSRPPCGGDGQHTITCPGCRDSSRLNGAYDQGATLVECPLHQPLVVPLLTLPGPRGSNSKCLRTRCVDIETIPPNSPCGGILELPCGGAALSAPAGRVGMARAKVRHRCGRRCLTCRIPGPRWWHDGSGGGVRGRHLQAGRADRPRVCDQLWPFHCQWCCCWRSSWWC